MGDSMSDPERIDEGIDAALESLHSAMKANPRMAEPEPKKRPPAKIIQLPLWPEPVRGMPNPALRSALFAAVQSKNRRFINYELIAAVNGIEIRFKGEQLNQEDLEVCAQVFHLARLHPLGDTCHMAAHAFLKSIGRHTGKSEHVQLHQSLLRLQAHSVEIKAGRYTYFGSLIEKGIKDEVTRHYVIKVNPDLAPLFRDGWTALDAEQRRSLRGKSLALWLHAFYASHEQPYPYKVETLRDLSGSRTASLRRFRAACRAALNELQTTGAIAAWKIDPSDLVHVDKIPAITRRRKTSPKAQK
jgi:TrfA protein